MSEKATGSFMPYTGQRVISHFMKCPKLRFGASETSFKYSCTYKRGGHYKHGIQGKDCILNLNFSNFFLVQTKVSWRTLFIIWYSRQRLGIKVQSCPVL